MAENRIPRDLQSREKAERPKHWAPPELLPVPNPEVGYEFRWVRVSTLNSADPMNISSKLREGWEPVRASEHPEIQLLGASNNARFPDSIEVGGLILCKMPTEMARARADYYLDKARAEAEAVDRNFMRENDARMPLFTERKSTVSFGKGS